MVTILCGSEIICRIGHHVFGECNIMSVTVCCSELKMVTGFMRIVKLESWGAIDLLGRGTVAHTIKSNNILISILYDL